MWSGLKYLPQLVDAPIPDHIVYSISIKYWHWLSAILQNNNCNKAFQCYLLGCPDVVLGENWVVKLFFDGQN